MEQGHGGWVPDKATLRALTAAVPVQAQDAGREEE